MEHHDLTDGDGQPVTLKISSSKEPGYAKSVAGAMGWLLREHGFCKARAIKMDAVNTAIKAIAIVNQRVAIAGISFQADMCLSPVSDGEGTAIAINIEEAVDAKASEYLEFKVSSEKFDDSEVITRLAGAISSRILSGGMGAVVLKCVGPGSVYKAILACISAKGLLHINGLSCVVVPKWATITAADGKSISVIEIYFSNKKI